MFVDLNDITRVRRYTLNLVVADNTPPYFTSPIESKYKLIAYRTLIIDFPPAKDIDTSQTVVCSFLDAKTSLLPSFITTSQTLNSNFESLCRLTVTSPTLDDIGTYMMNVTLFDGMEQHIEQFDLIVLMPKLPKKY